MNVFLFELKALKKIFITWNLVLVSILFALMGAMYPVYKDSANELTGLLESFPKGFLEVFGFDINSFFNYSGFYKFSYVYIGLIAAIMACLVGVYIFSREKKSKCQDFLFTKPKAKEKMFVNKFLSGIVVLFLTNVVFLIAMVTLMLINKQDLANNKSLVFASFGLFLLQIVFLCLGIFISIKAKKIRSFSSIATTVGFVAFIINAIANLLDEETVYYFSPLKYFEPGYYIENGHFNMIYMLLAFVICLVLLVISFIIFTKKDIHAV